MRKPRKSVSYNPPRRSVGADRSMMVDPIDSERPLGSIDESISEAALVIKSKINAAYTIYRFWKCYRKNSLRHMIKNFQELGITSEHIKNTSFPEVVVLLRERPVVHAAKVLLQRVHRMTVSLHGFPANSPVAGPGESDTSVNCRVFLALYMIALYPSKVFDDTNPLAVALLDSSLPLLKCFEGITQQFLDRDCTFLNVDVELRSTFSWHLFEYMQKFKAWKVPDEAKLTCRIKHALIALYSAEEQIPHEEPEDSRLKVEFRVQIERLRGRFQQLAGQEALLQFDAKYVRTGFSSIDSSVVITANIPNIDMSRSTVSSDSNLLKVSNQQLAHELILDPSFQIPDSHPGVDALTSSYPDQCIASQIRAKFHVAFWDSLGDDMRLELPCYTRVIKVLQEIKDAMLELGGSNFSQQVNGAMDLELIQTSIEANAFNWEDATILISNVVEIIRRLQSPARHANTNEKWNKIKKIMESATGFVNQPGTIDQVDQPGALCKSLEFLLGVVHVMRIDASNLRLRQITPVLNYHGIDYEKEKFNEKLKSGEINLVGTTAWVLSSINWAIDTKSVDLERLKTGSRDEYVNVLRTGFCHMLLNTRNYATIKPGSFPETFGFDKGRMTILEDDFNCMTSITALLAVTVCATKDQLELCESASDNDEQHVKHCKTKADSIAGVVGENVKDCNTYNLKEAFTNALMIELSKTALDDDTCQEIIKTVFKYGEPGSHPHSLFKKRILKIWTKRIAKSSISEGDLNCLNHGKVVIPRIVKATDMACRIFDVNIRVHGDLYNRLIRQAVIRFE